MILVVWPECAIHEGEGCSRDGTSCGGCIWMMDWVLVVGVRDGVGLAVVRVVSSESWKRIVG